MSETMSRHAAEHKYVEWIISHGNPKYFIFKYLDGLEDYQVQEILEEIGIEVEIEEEM